MTVARTLGLFGTSLALLTACSGDPKGGGNVDPGTSQKGPDVLASMTIPATSIKAVYEKRQNALGTDITPALNDLIIDTKGFTSKLVHMENAVGVIPTHLSFVSNNLTPQDALPDGITMAKLLSNKPTDDILVIDPNVLDAKRPFQKRLGVLMLLTLWLSSYALRRNLKSLRQIGTTLLNSAIMQAK